MLKSFEKRLWAKFLDYIIMCVVLFMLILSFGTLMSSILYSLSEHTMSSDAPEAFASYLKSIGIIWIVTFLLIHPIYDAVFHASKWQATFGKKILGIIVTNLEYQRISFSRSLIRSYSLYMMSYMTIVVTVLIWSFIGMYTTPKGVQPNTTLMNLLIIIDILALIIVFGLSVIQKRKQMIHDIFNKTLVINSGEAPVAINKSSETK